MKLNQLTQRRLRVDELWRFGLCCLFSFLILLPAVAYADSVDQRAKLLREAKDFRVRTQAALALGASNEKRAVTPLCQALNDENRTVRIAASTALGRLAQGGKGCLKRRLEKETDSKVKSSLARALSRLVGGSSGGAVEPLIGPTTQFYVAIEKLSGPARLNAPVRAALVKGARRHREVAFAPVGESTRAAEKALKKHPSAHGFLLAPRVVKPKYSNGQLKIKISIAMFSYPERALIGEFSQKVAMAISGTSAAAENELVAVAAEAAMKKFISVVPTLL
ncbi:MAG: HEAT repeat domain-containing protein [Polyangiaceae bacterium]|nr:HEAT repeat domain-containing protein [Polyangiaceae bacterium]